MSHVNELKHIKKALKLFRYVAPTNNYCRYGYAELLWLELVLTLLGCHSLREKVNFLNRLEQKGQLNKFYKNAHCRFRKGDYIPSIATLSQYKRHIKGGAKDYSHIIQSLLQDVVQTQFVDEQSVQLAIDGKRMLGTGKSRHKHAQSIHVLSGKHLLFQDFTHNELHWIKWRLGELLDAIKDNPLLSGKDVIVTGDGIYNTSRIRTIMDKKGIYYLFPTKSPSKAVSRVLARTRQRGQGQQTVKAKQQVITHYYELHAAPKNAHGISHVLKVERHAESLKTGKCEKTVQMYITNHPNPTLELFQTKLNHWCVETFHHRKDVWLHEDRYHKAYHNAHAISIINSLVTFILARFNITCQNQLKTLAFDIYEAIIRWVYKIYQTVLI